MLWYEESISMLSSVVDHFHLWSDKCQSSYNCPCNIVCGVQANDGICGMNSSVIYVYLTTILGNGW